MDVIKVLFLSVNFAIFRWSLSLRPSRPNKRKRFKTENECKYLYNQSQTYKRIAHTINVFELITVEYSGLMGLC